MGRRKSKNRNIRSLTKFSAGKSYGITLPIDIVKKFGWRERQKLRLLINEKGKTIVIKDWKR